MTDSTSYNYKNLTIDYSLLNQAATDIQNLSPEIDRIKKAARSTGRAVSYTVPGQVNDNNPHLGPDSSLYLALGHFYGRWGRDMGNAMDALDKMAGYFKGVADSFMETDAAQAAGLNLSGAMSAVLRYPAALDEWYKERDNASAQGKAFTTPQPTAPANPFRLTSGNGAVTTYTTQTDTNVPDADKTTHAPNVVLASETTTVTVNGMTYSETTTYQADQGWSKNGGPTQNTTQTIHNPDGSTDTITMTTDTSGKGTLTDYNSSSKSTSTYTRADWNSKWVDTTPHDQSSGSGDDNGPDAAPFVN